MKLRSNEQVYYYVTKLVHQFRGVAGALALTGRFGLVPGLRRSARRSGARRSSAVLFQIFPSVQPCAGCAGCARRAPAPLLGLIMLDHLQPALDAECQPSRFYRWQ